MLQYLPSVIPGEKGQFKTSEYFKARLGKCWAKLWNVGGAQKDAQGARWDRALPSGFLLCPGHRGRRCSKIQGCSVSPGAESCRNSQGDSSRAKAVPSEPFPSEAAQVTKFLLHSLTAQQFLHEMWVLGCYFRGQGRSDLWLLLHHSLHLFIILLLLGCDHIYSLRKCLFQELSLTPGVNTPR